MFAKLGSQNTGADVLYGSPHSPLRCSAISRPWRQLALNLCDPRNSVIQAHTPTILPFSYMSVLIFQVLLQVTSFVTTLVKLHIAYYLVPPLGATLALHLLSSLISLDLRVLSRLMESSCSQWVLLELLVHHLLVNC